MTNAPRMSQKSTRCWRRGKVGEDDREDEKIIDCEGFLNQKSSKVRAFNHLLGECGVTVFAAGKLATLYRRGFPQSLEGAPFLLPTENTDLRRSLDHWFETEKLHPLVVGEFEDSALLQVFGQSGMGLFAGPSAIESEIKRQYGVQVVGRIEAIRERFYAISVERKLKHPAVLAISDAARQKLFE